jgi:hypothetical protein
VTDLDMLTYRQIVISSQQVLTGRSALPPRFHEQNGDAESHPKVAVMSL